MLRDLLLDFSKNIEITFENKIIKVKKKIVTKVLASFVKFFKSLINSNEEAHGSVQVEKKILLKFKSENQL